MWPPSGYWHSVARAWIGTSGWTYESWWGRVYPSMPDRDRLEHYAHHLFDTVELNASYYRWPSDATFDSWSNRLPPWFRMTVKAPRALSHARRLYAPEDWITRIRRSLRSLGDRLGVVLLQLPPGLARDDLRLRYFLEHWPGELPLAVEFRHSSWVDDAVFDLLQARGVAYVVMSGAGLPCVLRATSDFVYVRLHGPDPQHLYAGSYSDDSLRWWADRVGEWLAQGRDVYAYFNNDADANAVRNASGLRSALRSLGVQAAADERSSAGEQSVPTVH